MPNKHLLRVELLSLTVRLGAQAHIFLLQESFDCEPRCSICMVPRAHHINFGHTHPPRKIIPRCPFGIHRMSSLEFPGSAFLLVLRYWLIGNPEFPGIVWHFPVEGFWGPQIVFSGEDEVAMLGSGDDGLRKVSEAFLGTHFPAKTFLRQRKTFLESTCLLTPSSSPPLTLYDWLFAFFTCSALFFCDLFQPYVLLFALVLALFCAHLRPYAPLLLRPIAFRTTTFEKDAAFLLTNGSFLLTVELPPF